MDCAIGVVGGDQGCLRAIRALDLGLLVVKVIDVGCGIRIAIRLGDRVPVRVVRVLGGMAERVGDGLDIAELVGAAARQGVAIERPIRGRRWRAGAVMLPASGVYVAVFQPSAL